MDFYQDQIHAPFYFERPGPVGALMLHGFPGTPAEVRLLGAALAERDISTSGILLPGFGPQISRLGEKSRRDWLSAAEEAWQEIQERYEKTILVGYSMGGAIATRLAAQTPPDRLVLLAPFWRFPLWFAHQFMPLIRRFKPQVSPLDMGGSLDDPAFQNEMKRFIPDLDFASEEARRFIREQMVLPTAVLEEVWRLGREAYARSAFLKSPVCVIQGIHDDVVRPAHTRQLVSRIRRSTPATYHEIPGPHAFTRQYGPYIDLVQSYLSTLIRIEV